MDRKLYEASFNGNVAALNALLQEDQLILDRISLTSFNETPLHIAALRGHLDFATLLLNHKPKLATSLDSLRRSPLHLASAEGHVRIVQELLRGQGGPNLCNSRDQDGNTPLHLAAMNEHLEVINVLTRARPDVVRETVDHDETILHLCIKHNRFEALKLLIELWSDEDVAKVIDRDGNSLLHLSAIHQQTETIKYLLNKSSVISNGNAVNGHGFTALDVLDHCPRDFKALEAKEILIEAGIKRAKDLKPLPSSSASVTKKPSGAKISQANISNSQHKRRGFLSRVWRMLFKNENSNWLERERGNLVIATMIIAAMSLHAGIYPPGDTYLGSNKYGYSSMDNFGQILTLVVSLSIILILVSGFNLKNKLVIWLLMLGTLTTFVTIIITYLSAIANMSPDTWINEVTLYLLLVSLIVFGSFGFITTVYFVVCAIKRCMGRRRRRRRRRNESTVEE